MQGLRLANVSLSISPLADGFSVYSVSLKAQCGLSQAALANINTIPYALGVASPFYGMIARRLGMRGGLAAGGLLIAGAFVTQYAMATRCDGGFIRTWAPFLLVFASCVTYIGVQFVTSIAFPVPVLFWPHNRSQVTAMVKSFVGLGGAVVAQTYRLLYGAPSEDPVALRCMLMWAAISLCCLLVGAVAMPTPPAVTGGASSMPAAASSREPTSALHVVFIEIALLGAFTTVTPLFPDGPLHDGLVAVMWLLALLPAPLMLLIRSSGKGAHVVSAAAVEHRAAPLLRVAASDASLPSPPAAPFAGCAESLHPHSTPPPHAQAPASPADATTPSGLCAGDAVRATWMAESETQYTLLQMMQTVDAWLLWFIGVVVIGGGAALTTNLAFIVQACHAPNHLVTSTGTTFSTGNLLGRLLTPVLSEVAAVRRGHARPWLLVLVVLCMAAGHLALLGAASEGMLAGSLGQQALLVGGAGLSGLGFGAMWPMLVVLASELFGRKHLMLNCARHTASIAPNFVVAVAPCALLTHPRTRLILNALSQTSSSTAAARVSATCSLPTGSPPSSTNTPRPCTTRKRRSPRQQTLSRRHRRRRRTHVRVAMARAASHRRM